MKLLFLLARLESVKTHKKETPMININKASQNYHGLIFIEGPFILPEAIIKKFGWREYRLKKL